MSFRHGGLAFTAGLLYLLSNFISILASNSEPLPEPFVTLPHLGSLNGTTVKTALGDTVLAFRSIPFAEPPVGNRRFQAPVLPTPWAGVREAKAESPQCIQSSLYLGFEVVVGQEDCLYLEVYTRRVSNDARHIDPKKPVIVAFHDGAFVSGSLQFNGPKYIMDYDCVLVTVNYRVGPFGFLCRADDVTSKNNGMKDQIMALQWVQDNIAYFGGDGNRVTIYGTSGASVHYHLLSPLRFGKTGLRLFHRAVMPSGSAFCLWAFSKEADGPTRELSTRLGCEYDNPTEFLNCMQSRSAFKIAEQHKGMQTWPPFHINNKWTLCKEGNVPGAFLPDHPEILHRTVPIDIPVLTGVNAADGAIFAASIQVSDSQLAEFNDQALWGPKSIGRYSLGLTGRVVGGKDAETEIARKIRAEYMKSDFKFKPRESVSRQEAVQMFTDRHFSLCTIKAIRFLVNINKARVYAYYFDYIGKYSLLSAFKLDPIEWGANHQDQDIYLFDSPLYPEIVPKLSNNADNPDFQIVRLLTELLYTFANDGVPTSKLLIDTWTPVVTSLDEDATQLNFLNINSQSVMIGNPYVNASRFYRQLQPPILDGPEPLVIT